MPFKSHREKWEREARKAIGQGLIAAAITLQAEMKLVLNKPGRGRIYARNKKANRVLRNPDVGSRGFGGVLFTSRAVAAGFVRAQRSRDKQRGVRKKRTLRTLGFHKASAPGDPPANDTGNYSRSLQTKQAIVPELDLKKQVVHFGSNVQYGAWLEFGYGGGLVKARPHWRPTIARNLDKMNTIFNATVKRTMKF